MDTVVVIGTRPEAIKLAPVIRQLRAATPWRVTVCATGQHEELLATALRPFGMSADVNLKIVREKQTLAELTASMLAGLGGLLGELRPELVVVQGDTTSTFTAALAAFYAGCRIAHVEAGLRTDDRLAPWPEEANRRMTAQLADWHFAPTESARANLQRESVAPERIHVTGNTVVDALAWIVREHGDALADRLRERFAFLGERRRLVLATLHRRENQDGGVDRVCRALQEIARRGDVEILFPVHPNPAVKPAVESLLGETDHVHLVAPLGYLDFVAAMMEARLIVSDSGGIQEEAPYLGVPVLLARDKTERPEAVECGAVRVVGTDADEIARAAHKLLDDDRESAAERATASPFGDGAAAVRIVDVLQAADPA